MPQPTPPQSREAQPVSWGGGVPVGGGGELRVLLFASLRQRAGWSERQLALPAGGTVSAGEIWQQLGLGEQAGLRVAINQRFAPAEQALQPGDELAFLPPISGG